MKSKIEIQILTPLTREQLVFIRDEIRSEEGMESFDLKLPPLPPSEGKMGGDISAEIFHAVIAGIAHFSADKIAHYLHPKITEALKKYKERKTSLVAEPSQAMGNSNNDEAAGNNVEVVITEENENGAAKTITYIDSDGKEEIINNREYSINADRTHAVIIGISNYDDTASFSAIPPAEGNVTDLYRVLNDKRLMGLPIENIYRLDNEAGITILKKLNEVSRKPGIETFIIYYAGHGQKTTDNRLNLIARDTHNIDEKLHNALAYEDLEKIIKSSPAAQKIIILDACHSGLAAQGSNANAFDLDPVYGTCVLASTSADDASFFKPNARNTYFTGYMLDLFKEGKKSVDKMLSLNDIFIYTTDRLKKEPQNGPLPQIKYDIKNVDKSKFYISVNNGFDLQALLKKPVELLKDDKLDEAEAEYIRLRKIYPDETFWIKEYEEQREQVLFAKFISAGDLSFAKAKYAEAKSKYLKAQQLNDGYLVRSKISECNKKLNAFTGGSGDNRGGKPKEPKQQQAGANEEGVKKTVPKPNWLKYAIGFIAITAVAFFLWKASTNKHNTSLNVSTEDTAIGRYEYKDTAVKPLADSGKETKLVSKAFNVVDSIAVLENISREYEKESKIVKAISIQNKALLLMNTEFRREEIERLKKKGYDYALKLNIQWVNNAQLNKDDCSNESKKIFKQIIEASDQFPSIAEKLKKCNN